MWIFNSLDQLLCLFTLCDFPLLIGEDNSKGYQHGACWDTNRQEETVSPPECIDHWAHDQLAYSVERRADTVNDTSDGWCCFLTVVAAQICSNRHCDEVISWAKEKPKEKHQGHPDRNLKFEAYEDDRDYESCSDPKNRDWRPSCTNRPIWNYSNSYDADEHSDLVETLYICYLLICATLSLI